MKIMTTFSQRWAFFIASCLIVSSVTVLSRTLLLLVGLFPIGITMWKLIDWAIEYQEIAETPVKKEESK